MRQLEMGKLTTNDKNVVNKSTAANRERERDRNVYVTRVELLTITQ